MKCPQCGQEGAKYTQRSPEHMIGKKKENWERTNFEATHKCGFQGVA